MIFRARSSTFSLAVESNGTNITNAAVKIIVSEKIRNRFWKLRPKPDLVAFVFEALAPSDCFREGAAGLCS